MATQSYVIERNNAKHANAKPARAQQTRIELEVELAAQYERLSARVEHRDTRRARRHG
jgi:hypothetical protein